MEEQYFFEEVRQIQVRHASLFPLEQLEFIRLEHTGRAHQLKFLEGYDLPNIITMEIEFAFKLVYQSPFNVPNWNLELGE